MLKYYMTRLPQGLRPVPTPLPRHNSVRFRRQYTWAEIAPPPRVPTISLSHTVDTVVLTAVMPALAADDFAIEVSRDIVLLQGQDSASVSFQRIVQLPIAVDHSRTTADFHDGVLTVTLPKLVTRRSTRIPVTIANNPTAVVPVTHDPAMDLSPEATAAAPPETADPIPGDPWQ
jgi:HSP20 family molecular chaperone IbpA